MKKGNAYIFPFGIFLLSCALFVCFYSGSPTVGSHHTSTGQEPEGEKSGSTAEVSNEGASGKARDRHEKPSKDPLAKPKAQPLVDLFNGDGELDEAALESHGLSKAQIDAAKEVLDEIAKAISEHFIRNCSEELIHDGSVIYVLKGDADLSLVLEGKMRTRLGEVIGLDSSGAHLADQITEGVKGQALLNFGADDMIGASYRDVTKDGKGWEDGMRINGKMPGMIDYYRENGWPDGADIHQSGGKAIFHPIKKTP